MVRDRMADPLQKFFAADRNRSAIPPPWGTVWPWQRVCPSPALGTQPTSAPAAAYAVARQGALDDGPAGRPRSWSCRGLSRMGRDAVREQLLSCGAARGGAGPAGAADKPHPARSPRIDRVLNSQPGCTAPRNQSDCFSRSPLYTALAGWCDLGTTRGDAKGHIFRVRIALNMISSVASFASCFPR
jgi:hypothetical protein